ncbi:putative entry exclusion protein TrbK-alt [Inquilinus limosus]|uniref:putative entry exclusion protein TrbK-alt n=1 Tax=Inquilinus limosus TaxID=171674 RepID=UPI003F188F99
MEPRTIFRAAALAVLGAALLATAVAVHRESEAPALVSRVAPERMDDASTELVRCRSLGLAAADDPGCKAAWARARDRFLGTDSGER